PQRCTRNHTCQHVETSANSVNYGHTHSSQVLPGPHLLLRCTKGNKENFRIGLLDLSHNCGFGRLAKVSVSISCNPYAWVGSTNLSQHLLQYFFCRAKKENRVSPDIRPFQKLVHEIRAVNSAWQSVAQQARSPHHWNPVGPDQVG